MTLRLASLAQGRARLRSCAATARQAGRSGVATAPRQAQGRPEQGRGTARQVGRITFVTAAAVVINGSSSVFACPVCFGAAETPMIDATRLGILVMLAITFAVQGGFVAFFLYLRKRAKLNADMELEAEWSELQRTSRT